MISTSARWGAGALVGGPAAFPCLFGKEEVKGPIPFEGFPLLRGNASETVVKGAVGGGSDGGS